MFISRFFAVAVAALASVSFVGAAPTAEKEVLVKRDTGDVINDALVTLQVGLVPLVAEITTAITNNDVSYATIGGPCNSIITLLTGANGQFNGLSPGSWNGQGTMPPSYNNCVNILVVIITLLIPCFGQLFVFISLVPQLLGLFVQLDLALYTLLFSIDFLLFGVIALVGSLVASVAGILQTIAFTLTFGLLVL